MSILVPPAYRVIDTEETEHDFHVTAEIVNPTTRCPHCQGEVVGFGTRGQKIMDLPVHGKRVGIWVERRRYRCQPCPYTFMEPLPDIHQKYRATTRLIRYIQQQSPERTFASLAQDVGVDEKTIRNVFREHVAELDRTTRFETPAWLGIDEIHILRKPRAVFANLQQHTLINLLPNRNKPSIVAALAKLDKKKQVQYVAMDMWNPYRAAVREVLPGARIVIDKFHIVRMANVALEQVRKSLRASLKPKERRTLMHDRFILLKRNRDLSDERRLSLSGWLNNYADLGAAYDLKEQFYGIWEASSRSEAERRYDHWRGHIPESLRVSFQPIVTAVTNWHAEVFTYFEYPITNAYTESLNNLIRVANRVGRGYSFEALRAKMLFTRGIHKVSKPKYRHPRKLAVSDLMYRYTSMTGQNAEREIDYGVDIKQLSRLLAKPVLDIVNFVA